MKTLDVITIGRSSVDLYGAQVGGRLEDMRSFDKYIGGSPTNIACGAARLGLRSVLQDLDRHRDSSNKESTIHAKV
jgi:5-dehydro-2-deoxygluconokinase